jgi:hypothetical protein
VLKKASMLLAILVFFGLVSCSQNDGKDSTSKEDTKVSEEKSNSPNEDKTVNNGEQQNDQQQGEKDEVKQYQNDAFKEVKITEMDDHIIVTGKARVFEGVFQYAIVSDGTVIKQDNYQTDGAPAWGDFAIPIKKELAAKEGTQIQLFVYSAKDGSKINILEIPIHNIK